MTAEPIRYSVKAPLQTPLTPGVGSKVKVFFSESSHVAYEMNWNGSMKAHILLQHTSLAPRVGSKDQNIFFLKVHCHVAYKMNGNEA